MADGRGRHDTPSSPDESIGEKDSNRRTKREVREIEYRGVNVVGILEVDDNNRDIDTDAWTCFQKKVIS